LVAPALREGRIATLEAGTILHHVHRAARKALDFNPHTDAVRWRFSPFQDDAGAVPSWYASLTPQGALCETVFRDLVMLRQRTIFRKVSLEGRVISAVKLLKPLPLLQLHGAGLIAMRLPQALTNCEPYGYRRSIAIGRHLYRACRQVAGFVWRSRIHNDHFSIVVYAPRTKAAFAEPGDSMPLNEGLGLAAVMELASEINCTIA
jgi:hypothetical protein